MVRHGHSHRYDYHKAPSPKAELGARVRGSFHLDHAKANYALKMPENSKGVWSTELALSLARTKMVSVQVIQDKNGVSSSSPDISRCPGRFEQVPPSKKSTDTIFAGHFASRDHRLLQEARGGRFRGRPDSPPYD